MTRRGTKYVRALAAILVTLGAITAGCETRPAGTANPGESRQTVTVTLDENSVARGTQMDATQVRVDIRSQTGALQLRADFQAVGPQRTLVTYTSFPTGTDGDMSTQPLTASAQMDAELPTVDHAIVGAALIQAQVSRAIHHYYDNWGCDLPSAIRGPTSCGLKGRCCDIHDACYREHECGSGSWLRPWTRCHIRCNVPAVACFTSRTFNPGPSECCSRGNCGERR
jgi:hypothetical protein